MIAIPVTYTKSSRIELVVYDSHIKLVRPTNVVQDSYLTYDNGRHRNVPRNARMSKLRVDGQLGLWHDFTTRECSVVMHSVTTVCVSD